MRLLELVLCAVEFLQFNFFPTCQRLSVLPACGMCNFLGTGGNPEGFFHSAKLHGLIGGVLAVARNGQIMPLSHLQSSLRCNLASSRWRSGAVFGVLRLRYRTVRYWRWWLLVGDTMVDGQSKAR